MSTHPLPVLLDQPAPSGPDHPNCDLGWNGRLYAKRGNARRVADVEAAWCGAHRLSGWFQVYALDALGGFEVAYHTCPQPSSPAFVRPTLTQARATLRAYLDDTDGEDLDVDGYAADVADAEVDSDALDSEVDEATLAIRVVSGQDPK